MPFTTISLFTKGSRACTAHHTHGGGYRLRKAGSALCVVLGVFGCLSIAQAQTETSPISYTISNPALTSQWQNWSWNTTYRYDQTTPDGDKALMIQYMTAGAGLYLHADVPISLAGLTDLKMWVQGGDKPQQIRVFVNNKAPIHTFTTTPRQWRLISIPLTTFENPTRLSDLYFQDAMTGEHSTWYIKTIYLEGREGVLLPETDVLVTPNPLEVGRQDAFLQFVGFTANESVQLTLTDMYGRVIRQHTLLLSSVEKSISVAGLAAGTYLISVVGQRGRHVRKLVLQ